MSTMHTDFTPQLEMIEMLRDGEISAKFVALREADKLTVALRESLRNGVPIDELSARSGLPVEDIRARVGRDLVTVADAGDLTGVA